MSHQVLSEIFWWNLLVIKIFRQLTNNGCEGGSLSWIDVWWTQHQNWGNKLLHETKTLFLETSQSVILIEWSNYCEEFHAFVTFLASRIWATDVFFPKSSVSLNININLAYILSENKHVSPKNIRQDNQVSVNKIPETFPLGNAKTIN